jgi:hypothetical protein
MSDQREWARQTLSRAAAEFAAWRPNVPRMTQSLIAHASKPSLIVGGSRTIEAEIVSWETNNETYRAALIAIAADAKVEKVVAAFGDKIPLTESFIKEARRTERCSGPYGRHGQASRRRRRKYARRPPSGF